MSTPLSSAKQFGHPYPLLLMATVSLVGAGLVMILSASSVSAFTRYGSSFRFFNRQVVGAVLGLTVMLAFSRLDVRKLKRLGGLGLVVTIALLVAVLIPGIGQSRGGSSRWLGLGFATFQPSELAKLAACLWVAMILDRKKGKITSLSELTLPIVPVAALLGVLILAQPDLGTALILGGMVLLMLFLAGGNLLHLSGLGLAGGVAAMGFGLMEGYRRARLVSFLNPWGDPKNTGYQAVQGLIALGSGGWLGLGLGASRQKWSYVPNAHTDFIFAIVGEELGLAGALAVLGLFVFLLYLGIRIARGARDRFSALVAGGITSWMGIQALINLGAVTGLLPITGVPLPLMSFGSSSLIFTLAGVGLLLSIARRSPSQAISISQNPPHAARRRLATGAPRGPGVGTRRKRRSPGAAAR